MTMMVVIAVAIVRTRNLFAVVMMTSVFSLLSAAVFVVLDAVDVAFTEAAVGAGISTVLMLGTLALTRRHEKETGSTPTVVIIYSVLTAATLIVATLDMPNFGDPSAPIHHHVAPEYIEGTKTDIGMPNIVTAVLASYRGFDTLGEVTVIFTAGVTVLILLGGPARPRRKRRKTAKSKEATDQ